MLALLVSFQARPVNAVALWHMDEGAGAATLMDAAGGDNIGTLINVTTGQPGDPAVSPTSTSYVFDGARAASFVSVSNLANLNPATRDVRFTVHVNFTRLPILPMDYGILRKGLSTAPGGFYKLELKRRPGDAVRASCGFGDAAAARAEITQGPNLADGEWHTITCAKTSTSIRLTVDAATFTKAATLGPISNTSAITFGRNEDGDDQYFGRMDEVDISVG